MNAILNPMPGDLVLVIAPQAGCVWYCDDMGIGNLAFSDDYPQMKQILEQIGTNRQVSQKKVKVEFARPFDSLLRVKALWGDEEGSGGRKNEGLPSDIEGSPIWSG